MLPDINEFMQVHKDMYRQIHVDCKRALWHLFKKEEIVPYLESMIGAKFLEGVNITELQYDTPFVRFHQRILERVVIDALR